MYSFFRKFYVDYYPQHLLFNCYHVETGPLICRAHQWTGFYMITASVMKQLKDLYRLRLSSLRKKELILLS